MIRKFMILMIAVLTHSAAFGGEHIPDAVVERATKLIPDFSESNIQPAPIAGLFQISIGPQLVYISADGRYIIQGDVIDLEGGENVTESARKRGRIQAVNGLGEDSMVVFSPQEVSSTITVFTDVTCPYCSKLHSEVGKLNAAGVKVRYLAFPRAGVPSSVYDQMASVWCADDPQQAMTDAKLGKAVEPKSCDNPVKEHFEMGRAVGVNGTPTIILEDGTVIGGYVPYNQLIEQAQAAHGGS
ncbi:MAG: DsbC family protein [Gammaproteobacteria bacterium]|nr:DsbC family protein [Gammaproteobacteria bacterium]